jgi:hypothetical protein
VCPNIEKEQFLMPIGYWWTVALVSWGVVCALTRWRGLRSFSAIPALLASELPFMVGYLLIASTVFALADGNLGSPGGAAGAAVALLALVGLMVVVRRAIRAHAALPTATGRAARWTCTTAATGRPARRSWCTSMAAPSAPATRPAKRGR